MEMPLHLEGAFPLRSESLFQKICTVYSNGLHFSMPASSLRANEADLVRGVLQILQGLSCSLFYWDPDGQQFHANTGIYVSHLSQKSLNYILEQFLYAASCLKSVEYVIDMEETSSRLLPPTLRAFSFCVSQWIKKLRVIAIKEEAKICSSDNGKTPTLLGLAGTLSSLCSGAKYLWRVVHGALPHEFIDPGISISASLIATHILNHLYEKLNEACLVPDGENEAYRMVLYLFVGSFLPYIRVLDSWIYEGILDDPFEEMFFFANKTIMVDEVDFWEKGYSLKLTQYNKLNVATTCAAPNGSSKHDKKEISGKESTSVRGKDCKDEDRIVCPSFIKDIVKTIVSAGKSLQLIQHTPSSSSEVSSNRDVLSKPNSFKYGCGSQFLAGLTLSEVFCVSLAALVGEGDHIISCFLQDDLSESNFLHQLECSVNNQDSPKKMSETLPALQSSKRFWCKILLDTLSYKGMFDLEARDNFLNSRKNIIAPASVFPFHVSFCPVNPVLTVCREVLNQNKNAWDSLNISRHFFLPPLKDEKILAAKEPNCGFEFQFHESLRSKDDVKALEEMFPFPTLLPSCQEEEDISEFLPFQNNGTLHSRVLRWIQSVEPRTTALPVVLVQECLVQFINRQVDFIGRDMLSMLMNGWRLMDELSALRAVYLLGSGDLLQHFLAVIFTKLDKGESWDEYFELNTILQESIRISCDGMLLAAPNSLVVFITKRHGQNTNVQHNATAKILSDFSFGIDGLHSLYFSYKVPWPLELIANKEAIKKYNQVMGFLLKVKRAKYVLDKTRQWIWKGRGMSTVNCKHHWLVEQKLLHFVDAFHQYVMDRVYHSAWRELCERMASARSLDDVIEVHEAYLLSIQRQCFVVPDKLWAMMASRINIILGLALDFHSLHQRLSWKGAVSKERCRMEVERIEKQLDDCIAFLLTVLSSKGSSAGQFAHLGDLLVQTNGVNDKMVEASSINHD